MLTSNGFLYQTISHSKTQKALADDECTGPVSGASAATTDADDSFDIAITPAQIRVACAATIADYAAVAQSYSDGNANHDVSQNIQAAIRGCPGPLDVLDLGCAGGRDACTFAANGHRVVAVAGSLAFARLTQQATSAREVSSQVEVICSSIYDLELGDRKFDVVFANAVLFHLPSAALSVVLARIATALKPDTGIFFASNAHGFGRDQEGWVRGRTMHTRSYVSWLSEATWTRMCKEAGLTLVEKFYRPPNRPRAQQPFLATAWKRVG